NQANACNGWCHDDRPESFINSAQYCRLSNTKPANMGDSGAHNGIGTKLGVVQPPAIASSRCMPVAIDMITQNNNPDRAPISSSLVRVFGITSVCMKSTPTCPFVNNT